MRYHSRDIASRCVTATSRTVHRTLPRFHRPTTRAPDLWRHTRGTQMCRIARNLTATAQADSRLSYGFKKHVSLS